jgi:hypothetical protein
MKVRRAATGLVISAGAIAAVSGVIAALKPVLDPGTPHQPLPHRCRTV